ncbi:hypothetical protein [Candidimonas nitroreducens]|uniref:Uncharacterized protein n=1 Tax=Candidimonas nitroreducens TaxID=683354 RepID=A0A225MQY7_9BURK|nr:hypothetical protein [Candidimonas nitroreducens]OWT61871.1 hypothetical protein CEY11_08545 [Candidimonas nitroreducens]
MAGDYGLDSGGNVVLQQPESVGSGPATRIGGGSAQGFTAFGQASQAPQSNFAAAADSSIRTLDALNKLTGGIMQQAIERAQKRQYFEGMAQVAQGKTLLDVEKEQPWYTKIFGPSASVQGAQAMTLSAALNKAESDFYTAMPDLLQKSPDEAREWLVGQMSQVGNTGDPNMDAMIQAKLAEQMPTMLSQHLKQHLKYVQEQNTVSFGNSIVTAGTALQNKTQAGAGFFTPEEMQLETQRAVDAFKPIPGMTPDAWQSTTVKALRSGMMQGNFAIYEAFKQSPMYAQLSQDNKTHLETQVLPYAQQWVQRNDPSYLDRWMDQSALQVALLHGGGPQTAEALTAWTTAQNEKWRVQSGSDKPLYDNAAIARLEAARQRGMLYLEHQKAIAQKARDKATAQAQDVIGQETAVQWSLNNGAMHPGLDNVSPDVAQRALDKSWQDAVASNDPVKLTNQINKLSVASAMGSKMVNKSLSMQMTTAANNFFTQGTAINDDMKQQLNYMRIMTAAPGGIAALGQYVGGENAAKMVAFMQSGVDMRNPSDVDAIRTAIMRNFHAPVSKEDRKDVANFLSSNDTVFQKYLPIFGQGALTPYSLNDKTKERLGSLLTPEVARMRASGVGGDAAVPLAFSIMFRDPSKVDYVDGTLSEPNPSSNWKSMFDAVREKIGITNQGSEDYQKAVTNVINNAMAKAVAASTLPTTQIAPPPRGSIPEAWVLDDATGKMRPFQPVIDPFDPSNYQSATARQIGPGILQVERMPKNATAGMQSVWVTITAQQVVDEYESLLKKHADTAAKHRARMDTLGNRQQDMATGFLFN